MHQRGTRIWGEAWVGRLARLLRSWLAFALLWIALPVGAESPTTADCLGCHDAMEPRITAEALQGSVHEGLACTDCHADVSAVPHEATPERVQCATCHPSVGAEHARGMHRIGSKDGVAYATECHDCHGSHQILAKDNPQSPVHHTRVPTTCKPCHVGVFENFQRSAHGALWLADDPRGPVCTTCHTAHQIQKVASKGFRVELPRECGRCHDDKAPSYRDSFHGQATSIGYLVAAKCSDCHTAHLNLPKSDPDSSVHPDHLIATCGECHDSANVNFVAFDPHPDFADRAKSPVLFYVTHFMAALLIAVFSFFGLHTLLWLQRTVVACKRGELPHFPSSAQYVQRFSFAQRMTHLAVVVSFLGLAATGALLMYHDAPWAPLLSALFGGAEVSRYFHRLFAVVTAGYATFHIGYLVRSYAGTDVRAEVRSGHTIIPRLKDARDLFENLRWFLYLGPRPQIGRWAYWEKFDYFAIFWGVPVIGISGLMLWFPEFFTRFLPGVALNIAMVVHGEEALLAIGFIFIFHFFHVHLRPENFPFDPVIFTGRIPLERFQHERPEEYADLVRSGRLADVVVGPPAPRTQRFAYVFGYSALGIGIGLVLLIFVAYLWRIMHMAV
ncbi:MAG: hypothetical protein HY696_08040 [Deltaproteobacteria bacterium]|nr:hypothetical protein [Deltaproteobacteria bacterium]